MVNDISLHGLDARLGKLEALHQHELAGMPGSARDSLAPSPDYRSDLPPAVERCSCEEAEALRAEIEVREAEHDEARARVRELETERDTFLSGQLATLQERVRELESELDQKHAKLVEVADKLRIERVCGKTASEAATAERKRRLELERAFAVAMLGSSLDSVCHHPSTEEVLRLIGAHACRTIGTCDRCGKRAPLREQLVDSCEAPKTRDVCAWGCEVAP